ncbi:MAG: glycosyltransferase family 39 protein, partial [Actinomycetota bacterium]
MKPGAKFAVVLSGVILLAVAFVPRALSLDRALTIDERLWIDRSERFVENIFDGHLSRAYETGHPGVTVMWLGGLAQKTLPDTASLRDRYVRARLALSIADTALILFIAWVLASVAGGLAGVTGGLLLALDPFLLAHNRVLHLDGLLALLMAASLLSLMRGLRESSARWMAISGVLAGLAALTKQPSVFLVAAALVLLWRDGRGILRRFGLWVAAAAVGAFLLYPVLWVSTIHPLGLMLGSAARGASDSHSGGFFLGRPVGNPGPLFYPVVFLWRTSVLTLPASIATTVWVLRSRGSETKLPRALLLFGLGFALMMTFGFKKGDRYLLPTIVAVDLAVAVAASRVLAERPRGAVAAALVAGAVL